MTAPLLSSIRKLWRCEHADAYEVMNVRVCELCGARSFDRRGRRDWTRPQLLDELLNEPGIDTVCQLDDLAFKRMLAGTEALVERMETTENAASFAWAASQTDRTPTLAIPRTAVESSAAEGATCDNPKREAVEAAQRNAGPMGEIDLDKLPKCGNPAVVCQTTSYENAPALVLNFCERHRPRRLPL